MTIMTGMTAGNDYLDFDDDVDDDDDEGTDVDDDDCTDIDFNETTARNNNHGMYFSQQHAQFAR